MAHSFRLPPLVLPERKSLQIERLFWVIPVTHRIARVLERSRSCVCPSGIAHGLATQPEAFARPVAAADAYSTTVTKTRSSRTLVGSAQPTAESAHQTVRLELLGLEYPTSP
ncbi:hypothetical protein HPB50_015659 [Hyalomma asiaticum]|uniref:Uncharacterized protein n=1 Tax=Hyalomma asiaticum TaxID=266040 RepID=A0ACB7TPU0_HYAAI|nr:hypothetical protein HPB50_015659 [Hyalomma asiaticum]